MKGSEYQLKVELDFDDSFYESYKEFDNKSFERGYSFEEAVFETLSSIELNPFIWQVRYRDVRAAVIPKFPFLILYRVDEVRKEIQILDLIGQSTNWLQEE